MTDLKAVINTINSIITFVVCYKYGLKGALVLIAIAIVLFVIGTIIEIKMCERVHTDNLPDVQLYDYYSNHIRH